MNKRKTGSEREETVCRYLTEKGYTIADRNFYSRFGEIDIVALRDGFICFVEVKYRSSDSAGMPEEAVNSAKIKKISKTAEFYLLSHKQYKDMQPRFDVAAVLPDGIRYHENAFSYGS